MMENRLLEKALDWRYLEPYAGKWVAIVEEKVIAWGETPMEVLTKIEGITAEPEIMKVPRKEEGPYILWWSSLIYVLAMIPIH